MLTCYAAAGARFVGTAVSYGSGNQALFFIGKTTRITSTNHGVGTGRKGAAGKSLLGSDYSQGVRKFGIKRRHRGKWIRVTWAIYFDLSYNLSCELTSGDAKRRLRVPCVQEAKGSWKTQPLL